jgi:hypothetical protein
MSAATPTILSGAGFPGVRPDYRPIAVACGCLGLGGLFVASMTRMESGSWPLTFFALAFGLPWIGRAMSRDAALSKLIYPVLAWQLCLVVFHLFWMVPYYALAGMDALGYHEAALDTAGLIRDGQWSELSLGFGNRAVVLPTAVLYALFGSSFAGMFVIASLLGLAGMIGFHRALALWEPAARMKKYALLLFLWPSLGVWRSLYGKDCLVMFGLGTAAYGYSLWLATSRKGALVRVLLGASAVFLVRPYIGFVLAASMMATEIWRRNKYRGAFLLKAAISLALFVPLLSLTGSMAGEYVNLKSESVEGLLEAGVYYGKGNAIGGSVVLNPDINGLIDYLRFLPEALVRLMVRPFPWEAHNLNAWMATAENLLMLFLLLRSLRMLSALVPHIRRHPYALFALLMVIEMTVIYSLLTNLGLISRMKAQIYPFLFVLLFATARSRRLRRVWVRLAEAK